MEETEIILVVFRAVSRCLCIVGIGIRGVVFRRRVKTPCEVWGLSVYRVGH